MRRYDHGAVVTKGYTGPAWLNSLLAFMGIGIVLVKVLSAVMDNEVEWKAT